MYHHRPDFERHLSNAGQALDCPSSLNRSLSSINPVVLDDYNSDLNFLIEGDGFTCSTIHRDGFEYLWAGARATYGVKTGKACFEVHIMEKLPVKMPDTEQSPHVARVGWSTDDSGLIVGEEKHSYGYGGTGKSSVNNRYLDYGEPYTVNDVISCYIDLDKKESHFTKNGHYLGMAFEFQDLANGVALFPHVTLKNMKVKVNFGYYPPTVPLIDGFTMIERIPRDLLVRGTSGPATRRDCQVIMMVGLPGAGKTYWASEYTREHKDRKINVLATNTIMDKMKITGLTRNRNYHGRWDQLIKQATNVLNKMFDIAEKKNRNYIIDQTNVYPNARRRKIGRFHGFRRIAAVIVNTNEVLKERTEKREREEGKIVPASAIMEMKVNFTLPEVSESFDDVWFLEQDRENCVRLLVEFQQEGKTFKENERKNEEMKRKRGNSFSCDAPPAKEQAYKASRDNGGPRYPCPPRPRDTSPYGASNVQAHTSFPPPHHHSVADRGSNNYRQPHPSGGPQHGDYRQQPQPYLSLTTASTGSASGQHNDTRGSYSDAHGHYNDPACGGGGYGTSRYNDKPNYPIQESSQPGCSPFASMVNVARNQQPQSQENDSHDRSSGRRHEDQQSQAAQWIPNYPYYEQYHRY